jgi:hypothetical protein
MTPQKKSKEGAERAHGGLRVGEPSSGLGGWESKCEISVLCGRVGRSHKIVPLILSFALDATAVTTPVMSLHTAEIVVLPSGGRLGMHLYC